MNNNLLIFFAEIVFKYFQKTHFQKESPYFHASFTNRKNAKQRFLHLMTEDMGFEPTHAFTRLTVFKTVPFSRTWVILQDNTMDLVGLEPTTTRL